MASLKVTRDQEGLRELFDINWIKFELEIELDSKFDAYLKLNRIFLNLSYKGFGLEIDTNSSSHQVPQLKPNLSSTGFKLIIKDLSLNFELGLKSTTF